LASGALTQGQSKADFLTSIAENFDRSVTWADLDWICAEWDGPLVVKGVLDPSDARDAVKAGAQAIVVSNHGCGSLRSAGQELLDSPG